MEYMYSLVFYELSKIKHVEFIVESCEIQRILGVIFCFRKFVLLPTSGRELILLNIFITVNDKNNV